MTDFISALATGADWKTILADVGGQLAGASPGSKLGPNGLGFIYTTEPLADHFSDIVITLRDSVLIAPWSEESFRVFATVSTTQALQDMVSNDWASQNGPVFGLAHGDPRNRHLGEIVEALPAAGDGYFVGG